LDLAQQDSFKLGLAPKGPKIARLDPLALALVANKTHQRESCPKQDPSALGSTLGGPNAFKKKNFSHVIFFT
jgi:hypothetical protein